jgi:murein peptide amidase A
MGSRRTVLALLTPLLVTAPMLSVVPQTDAAPVTSVTSAAKQRTVIESRTIGHTVRGRAITAYRVGNPESDNKVLVLSTMHGDERDTRWIVRSIRMGKPVHGIDLWLIGVLNHDGLARNTRKNAHGVDLNRNYPYHWANLNGSYESGPHAASEPETRALMRFIKQIRPQRVVSIHQPLHGVDVSTHRSRKFGKRLAAALHLPQKNLTCGGVCHGTFTQWFMHKYGGRAVTVEYGAHPTKHRMRVTAPRQLIRVLGGSR